MVETIINNFEIWVKAQTQKSKGRGLSADNQRLYGINKLRDLILELAVRGKLVPQDPNDEPASVLLKKIATKKEKLVKEGKIKIQDSLPKISETEMPFELPPQWIWTRFGNISYQITDGTHYTPTYLSEGIPFLSVKDMSSGSLDFSDTKFISKEQHEEFIRRCNPQQGDLLLTKVGTTGIPVLIETDRPFSIFVSVALIKFAHDLLAGRFLSLLVKSPLVKIQSEEGTEGIGNKNLVLRKIVAFLVVIPPLAEQHRIVSKVEELMTLCDQLEKEQMDSNAAHEILVETLLDTLTNAAGQAELESAWERIASHFDMLFTTEHSVDRLKQTILQLAVMGKLVPQNPGDEPAGELLKRIGREKAWMVKEGKIKKQEVLPEIREDEKTIELPEGWEFVRLGNIANRIGSGSTPRGSAYEDSGIIFLRSQNVWNHGLELNDVAYISKEMHQKMSNTVVYPNDILLNITGASLGRSAIFPSELVEANVSQHVTIIRPTLTEIKDYLHLCIQSPYIQKLVWGRQVGMAREGLSKKVLELFEIPLPPLAEQHRIVAKVDELFGICDALKERIREAQGIERDLADAVVEGALS